MNCECLTATMALLFFLGYIVVATFHFAVIVGTINKRDKKP